MGRTVKKISILSKNKEISQDNNYFIYIKKLTPNIHIYDYLIIKFLFYLN
jgi:phage anti-repressor protein